MQKRRLGELGEEVSILGLGGFHLLEITDELATNIVRRYLEGGGNLIESAAEYGDGISEKRIGRALGKDRDKVFLASKVPALDKKSALRLIDRSLDNLMTTHLDLLFMHHIQSFEELERMLAQGGTLEAALEARKMGKIRFIGISSHGIPDVIISALERFPFDVVYTAFNYYDKFNFPEAEGKLIPLALEKGAGIMGFKPLADGYLHRSVENAFRYAWTLPLSSVVTGANSIEMLEHDMTLAERFTPMSIEEKDELYKNAPEYRNYVCRFCEKCSCPIGIDIPRIFRLEGYYDRQMWDRRPTDPAQFALDERLRFWFGNAQRAREMYRAEGHKLDACDECGKCEDACPYGIPVVYKLKNANYKLTIEPPYK